MSVQEAYRTFAEKQHCHWKTIRQTLEASYNKAENDKTYFTDREGVPENPTRKAKAAAYEIVMEAISEEIKHAVNMELMFLDEITQ